MVPIQVLYHSGCADGYASAWCAWQTLDDVAQYRPVQYGQPIPEIHAGASVFILDFSYPRDELTALARRSSSVVVLDHHATAEQALDGLDGAVPGLTVRFDMARSGAAMTWDWFNPERADLRPRIVDYVQDRDLWAWKLPRSREFSAALAVEPRDFRRWDVLEADLGTEAGMEEFLQRGDAILAAKNAHVESLCNYAVMTDVAGHRVPCLNSPLFQSEIGERLCERHPDAPFAAVFFIPESGKEVWSLRSRNGFDVSAVAKSLGGGGHAAAAGFVKTTGPKGD